MKKHFKSNFKMLFVFRFRIVVLKN